MSAEQRLPADVRASVSTLLASLPDMEQLGTAKGLAQALNNSGAFLEAKLLAGAPAALAPDLKAQVIRLVAQLLPGLPAAPSSTRPWPPAPWPRCCRAWCATPWACSAR